MGHVFRAGDPEIAELASGQDGVVQRGQLTALGLGRGAIDHRIARDRLHRMHQAVYLAGHTAEPERARYRGAVLACGPAAYISHGSALELYGLVDRTDGPIHVTVIAGRRRSRRGLRVHRTRRFDPQDFGTLQDGLRITSPARAILDYCEYARAGQVSRVVNQAHSDKRATPEELYALIARMPGRHCAPLLKATLARHDGPARFNSGGERIVLALVKRARLPRPEVNARADGEEIDFLYRDVKLAIEIDGGTPHGTPAAVDRDRRKDAKLRNLGYEVLRYSWWQIEEDTEAVIAEISATLERRRAGRRAA